MKTPSFPVPDSIGQRRPLSGGGLSLLLLLGALAFCLLLGVGVARSRGLELQVQPSWLLEEQTQNSAEQSGGSDGITPSPETPLNQHSSEPLKLVGDLGASAVARPLRLELGTARMEGTVAS